MRRGVAAFCAALLAASLVAGVGPAASGVAGETGPASTDAPDSLRAATQEFDRTEFAITVYGNGSARWTFRYFRTLENATERSDFESFATEFESTRTPLYADFVNRSRDLAAAGERATGRNMSATAFRRSARVNELGNQGIVELSFRWEGLAAVDGDRVVVGDVFEGGLYIRADQRLVVSHGPDLRFGAATPDPDSVSGGSLAESESVTWAGERSFTDGRPRLVFVPPDAGAETPTDAVGGTGSEEATPTTGGGGGAPPTDGNGNGGNAALLAVGLLVLVGVGAVLAYRFGLVGGDDGDAVAAEGGAEATTDTGGEADDAPEVSDEMLLSDEDRVMGLLEDAGGRMKQVNIVEETGWSKSKVSMLLSEMEEEELISKLRVGRENIISKKGMEPEAARSPFEDEDG